MAKTGWKKGWLDQFSWAKPIGPLLEQEDREAQELAAREEKLRQDEAIAEAETSRKLAKEAKLEEAQVIRVARKDVLGLLTVGAKLVPAMHKLSEAVVKAAEDGKLTAQEAMKLMRDHSLLVARSLAATQMIVQVSRLDRGEPTAIVQEQLDFTPEEAEREIELANAALERARRKGLVPQKPSSAAAGENGAPPGKTIN